MQALAVAHVDLRAACVERGDLRRPAGRGVAVEPAGGEGGFDLRPPRGPLPIEPGRDAVDFPRAVVVAAGPSDAEPVRQFGAQGGLVDPVGRLSVLIGQAAVERGTAPVGGLEDVRENRMGVQLRVALTRAAVREIRAEEPEFGPVLAVDAPGAEPRDARGVTQIADRCVDGGSLRAADLAACRIWRERPQRRDRLGW